MAALGLTCRFSWDFRAAIVLNAWAWDARHVIGMAMAAIGLSLWFTARLQLGKSFALLPKAQALVTTGLYSKFRQSHISLRRLGLRGPVHRLGQGHSVDLLFLVYPAYQFLRARKEAEVLEEAFGDEYRRYKAARGCDSPPWRLLARLGLVPAHLGAASVTPPVG